MQALKFGGLVLGKKAKEKKLQISQAHTDSFTQGPTVAFNKHKQKGLIYISLSLTITAEMYLQESDPKLRRLSIYCSFIEPIFPTFSFCLPIYVIDQLNLMLKNTTVGAEDTLNTALIHHCFKGKNQLYIKKRNTYTPKQIQNCCTIPATPVHTGLALSTEAKAHNLWHIIRASILALYLRNENLQHQLYVTHARASFVTQHNSPLKTLPPWSMLFNTAHNIGHKHVSSSPPTLLYLITSLVSEMQQYSHNINHTD